MGLAEQIKPEDWRSVRSAIAKLNTKLGPTSKPTFAGIGIGIVPTSICHISDVCTVAAGKSIFRVTGLQTDSVAMTGTLRGAYIDVSNGSLAATGTIRGMELKARTEAPGDTGNNVTVLEGLSISADSKGHSVTTMRAAEFILDGKTGGTITEAVGLRIANNLQANKATTSYGLQIYCDSFAYTADIQLSNGALIGISTSGADLKLSPAGNVGIQLPSGVEPSALLSIGSTSGAEQLDLYHTGSHAVFRTTVGEFTFRTKNTSNRSTYFSIYGNSSPGIGYFRLFDEDEAEYIEIRCSSGYGYIKTVGSSPGPLSLQDSAHNSVRLFENATNNETQELIIYGYKDGDQKRNLEIGVGVDAADTASFDGVSNYKFDGNIEITGLTASRLIATDANKKLISSGLVNWVTGTANRITVSDDDSGGIILTGPQEIHTGASPTFASLKTNILRSVTDTHCFIQLAAVADVIYIRPGFESDDNIIVFKSEDGTITSPMIYPSTSNEGQLGTSTGVWNKLWVSNIQIGANNLDTTEWAFLDGLDQALKTTDSPTFDELTLTAPTQNYKFTDYSSVLALQAQTSGTYTGFWLYTKDGDRTDDCIMALWGMGTPAQMTNTEVLLFKYIAASCFEIRAIKGGSGTARPLILYTESNTNQLYLDTDGQVGVGKVPTAKVDINGDCKIGDGTNETYFSATGVQTMAGSAKVKQTVSFTFHHNKITAQGAPTRVTRGVFEGWTLPIWSDPANLYEELVTCECIIYEWDGTTDPIIYIGGWLDTANTSKKFQLQVSVETADFINNAVVPATVNSYPVETTTGTWAQYTGFKVQVTVDASDIGLAIGQPLTIRIRRIAASTDEIAGNPVIEGAVVEITADKLGGAT